MLRLIAFIFVSFCLNQTNLTDPDEHRGTIELITSKGYPAEQHVVVTADGYVLEMHRIPNSPKRKPREQNNPVVFLQHGLLDTSATWVLNEAEQSLGFILADQGFDVWLGNMRGNTYGRKHAKYDVDSDEFWNFSFDEMAVFDLPAMIYFVLNVTNQNQVFYVGHSQGTLISFARLGTDLDLASKIRLFVGLGPVATAGHLNGLLRTLAILGEYSDQKILYELFGKRAFLPNNKYIDWLADNICTKEHLDKIFCENIIFLICGPSKYMNYSRIDVYASHAPAGTSVKNMAHFSQLVATNSFQMYDYGSAKSNFEHYNQTTAPLYSLNNIKIPVAIYWAKHDWLADPNDIKYLRSHLHNLVDDYEVQDWDHLDFIWATDAKQELYDRIIQLINQYI